MYIEKFKSFRKVSNFLIRSDTFSLFSLGTLLYLLGIFCFFLVYTNNAMVYMREQIPFFLTLKDSAKEADIYKLQQKLKISEYITEGSVVYVSKEEAMKKLTDENLTKDDLMLFGENLLPNSIEFKMNVQFSDKFDSFLADLKKDNTVDEIAHNEIFAVPVESNLTLIVLIVIMFILFFIFVANNLIKNTLRLSLNENKKIIALLEISGAHKDYIRKPYFKNYTFKGIFTGFLSTLAVSISLYLLHYKLVDLNLFIDWKSYALILSALFLLSIFINRFVLYITFRSFK